MRLLWIRSVLWPGTSGDAAAVLEMISGADRRDSTSIIKKLSIFPAVMTAISKA